jgi:hypothetical protein
MDPDEIMLQKQQKINFLKKIQHYTETYKSFITEINNISSSIDSDLYYQLDNINKIDLDKIIIKYKKITSQSELNNNYKYINQLSLLINNELYTTCEHCFVDDDIDIDTDYSKKIIYCKYCFCNKI